MMNEQLEKDLDAVMTAAMKQTKTVSVVPKTEQGLAEQWEIIQKAKLELRHRLRTMRIQLENDLRTRRQAIEHQFQRDLEDAQSGLEKRRDAELRDMMLEIKEKLREFDHLRDSLDG